MVCDWCGGIIFGDKYWTVTGLSGNFCSERCCEEAKARQRLEDAGVR